MPLGRVGAQHDAQLSHDGRRMGVVPLHVADDGPDPAAGQRNDVVPVAPDVPAQPGRAVPDGDLRPRHVRDPARQHGLLEALGEVVLLLVQHGPLQALRDGAAERDQQIAFVAGEAVLVAVEQAERADGAGLGDQWQIGGRGDAEVADVGPQDRVRGGEVGGGLDEAGRERAHHLAHRVLLVRPGVAGAGHERVLRAVGHQMDASGLHQSHDQAGRTEMRQALGVLEHLDDVPDGAGVGQRRRGAVHQAGASAPLQVQLLAGGGVGQLLGRVADDADDAVRAAGPVPPDEALGVGPAETAVAPFDPEVGAVVALPALERLRDHGVQPHALVRRHPLPERLRPVVVLLGPQVEHVERGPVHVHEATVEIPVEAAHTVQGEAEIRVGGPVVRE